MSHQSATAKSIEPAAQLSLRLLDRFELRRDGVTVEVPRSSQRLLAYLALHDHPLPRAQVSGTLWMDSPETRAHGCLRSAIWRTPSYEGSPLLQVTTISVGLSPELQVDLRASVARARQLTGDSIDVAAELAAFGNDLLPGWYDEWVEPERERFRELRLQTLERLGAQLLGSGRFEGATELALVAVQADPLRDTARRLLVRAYIDQGNVGEAVRQFRQYARQLDDELGARPSPAMHALIEPALSHHRPATLRLPHADRLPSGRSGAMQARVALQAPVTLR